MLRRDFAKALIGAGVAVAAPTATGESNDSAVLDDVQRLTVKTGDVLVLTFAGHVSSDTAYRIREHFSAAFPNNKLIVVGDGGKFSVIGA